MLIYFVYPTILTFYYSFTSGTVVNPAQAWVGLKNFVRLFTEDPFFLRFGQHEWRHHQYGGLANRLPLRDSDIRPAGGRARRQSALRKPGQIDHFLPMVVSATAASVIFRFVFNRDPNLGVVNSVFNTFLPNFQPVGWLGNPDIANLAVIASGIWIWTGLSMVVLSAAYKSLPKDVLESATVDGANALQAFLRISIPMMSRTIIFVLMTMVINALKMIDLVLVMTQGGPQGSTRVIGFTVFWEMFNNQKLGYGSAVAVVLFVLIIPFIIIQIRNVRAEVR